MLTVDLINNNIPRLRLQDTVGKALQLINDFRVSHLPVVAEEKFLGLISEEDLLDAEDEKLAIEVLQNNFVNAAVKNNVHFLNAVSSSIQFDTTVVPIVTGENEFVGVITTADLLKTLGNFSGANEIGGIIVIDMERSQFAISEISRIVESNDCHVLHLNTTVNPVTGILTVTIHINKREISAVVATFERYEYDVTYYFGTEKFENEIDSNFRHLMNYLDI
ncbi:CBS domain-containing protein [Ferruginibacter sp. HRS2-29]|uniref:CBS domain-containing protein n=1 Tax=Ferruginibacter sp. HRS2-29 TaxID=2487334 RepID=UPI0020CD11A3|nr:CBS domain-containing protein [Ferruginibacter sp. HRS2-29]MCP9750474.1 CBS domain-containing protein [Ferruginibacter sp. HRS2-29]